MRISDLNNNELNDIVFPASVVSVSNTRTKLTLDDVHKLTSNSIAQGRNFVELPDSADLSGLFSLNSGYYDERQMNNGNKVKYPDLHMIIGENSILPSRMNNCSIGDGCIAPSNLNMNNCAVYGTLFIGATNSYQGGTARIKNSVISNLSSIGGGLVVAKNCTFSNVNCRILKLRETVVKESFVEDKLILDGLNIVMDTYVGDTVEWIGKHNIMGGNVVIMGKDGVSMEFDNEGGKLSYDKSNKIVVGNINTSNYSFMPTKTPIGEFNQFAIQPLSIHAAKEGSVVLPVNLFNAISSDIDKMCFTGKLNAVPLSELIDADSINTNINNLKSISVSSSSVTPSV